MFQYEMLIMKLQKPVIFPVLFRSPVTLLYVFRLFVSFIIFIRLILCVLA